MVKIKTPRSPLPGRNTLEAEINRLKQELEVEKSSNKQLRATLDVMQIGWDVDKRKLTADCSSPESDPLTISTSISESSRSKRIETRSWKCSICCNNSFPSAELYQKHLQGIAAKLICPYCNKCICFCSMREHFKKKCSSSVSTSADCTSEAGTQTVQPFFGFYQQDLMTNISVKMVHTYDANGQKRVLPHFIMKPLTEAKVNIRTASALPASPKVAPPARNNKHAVPLPASNNKHAIPPPASNNKHAVPPPASNNKHVVPPPKQSTTNNEQITSPSSAHSRGENKRAIKPSVKALMVDNRCKELHNILNSSRKVAVSQPNINGQLNGESHSIDDSFDNYNNEKVASPVKSRPYKKKNSINEPNKSIKNNEKNSSPVSGDDSNRVNDTIWTSLPSPVNFTGLRVRKDLKEKNKSKVTEHSDSSEPESPLKNQDKSKNVDTYTRTENKNEKVADIKSKDSVGGKNGSSDTTIQNNTKDKTYKKQKEDRSTAKESKNLKDNKSNVEKESEAAEDGGFYCSACAVYFSSIVEHLLTYHSEEEVEIEDDAYQEVSDTLKEQLVCKAKSETTDKVKKMLLKTHENKKNLKKHKRSLDNSSEKKSEDNGRKKRRSVSPNCSLESNKLGENDKKRQRTSVAELSSKDNDNHKSKRLKKSVPEPPSDSSRIGDKLKLECSKETDNKPSLSTTESGVPGASTTSESTKSENNKNNVPDAATSESNSCNKIDSVTNLVSKHKLKNENDVPDASPKSESTDSEKIDSGTKSDYGSKQKLLKLRSCEVVLRDVYYHKKSVDNSKSKEEKKCKKEDIPSNGEQIKNSNTNVLGKEENESQSVNENNNVSNECEKKPEDVSNKCGKEPGHNVLGKEENESQPINDNVSNECEKKPEDVSYEREKESEHNVLSKEENESQPINDNASNECEKKPEDVSNEREKESEHNVLGKEENESQSINDKVSNECEKKSEDVSNKREKESEYNVLGKEENESQPINDNVSNECEKKPEDVSNECRQETEPNVLCQKENERQSINDNNDVTNEHEKISEKVSNKCEKKFEKGLSECENKSKKVSDDREKEAEKISNEYETKSQNDTNESGKESGLNVLCKEENDSQPINENNNGSIEYGKESEKDSNKCEEESEKVSIDCKKEPEKVSNECGKESEKVSNECGKESKKVSNECEKESEKISNECGEESEKVSNECGEESKKVSNECEKESEKISNKYGNELEKVSNDRKKSDKVSNEHGDESEKISKECDEEFEKVSNDCEESEKVSNDCEKKSKKITNEYGEESEKVSNECEKALEKVSKECAKESKKESKECEEESEKVSNEREEESEKFLNECEQESEKEACETDVTEKDKESSSKCCICNVEFTSARQASKHKLLHSNPDAHHCSHCPNVYQLRIMLDEHISNVHSK